MKDNKIELGNFIFSPCYSICKYGVTSVDKHSLRCVTPVILSLHHIVSIYKANIINTNINMAQDTNYLEVFH